MYYLKILLFLFSIVFIGKLVIPEDFLLEVDELVELTDDSETEEDNEEEKDEIEWKWVFKTNLKLCSHLPAANFPIDRNFNTGELCEGESVVFCPPPESLM